MLVALCGPRYMKQFITLCDILSAKVSEKSFINDVLLRFPRIVSVRTNHKHAVCMPTILSCSTPMQLTSFDPRDNLGLDLLLVALQ